MATNFFIRTNQKSGNATVFVRVRSRKNNIDIKTSSNVVVDIERWNFANSSPASMKRFRASATGALLFEKLDEIEKAVNLLLSDEKEVTVEKIRATIDNIVYKEQIEVQRKEDEIRNQEEELRKRMTLRKYIDLYMSQIRSGARATYKGTNFAPKTITAINVAVHKLEGYQEFIGRELDFADTDMNFYRDFTAYLKSIQYSINSIGKVIKTIKTILLCAEEDGYSVNPAFKTKAFKATRVDVDAIYLTQSELDAFQRADLDNLAEGYKQARDIFMIGVWTAQRISDYNHLTKDNFFEQTMYDKNDKGKITEHKQRFVKITQEKTKKTVIIPCSKELCSILDKYPEGLPHLEDQVINRYIKEIGCLAHIDQMVEIITTKGGSPVREKYPKFKLIHSHTARRTGATLMYLSGMNVYDICKITGHRDIKTLEKYIKATDLETIKKISKEYDYFK